MKISKEQAKIMSLFFVVFMPELCTQIKPLFYLISLCAIWIFVNYFYYYVRNNSFPLHILLWLLVCSYLLIIMILNGNISDIDQWGKLTIFVSDLILLLDYYCKKGKTKDLLSAVTTLGIIMLSINVASMIVFPNGIIHTVGGNYYFLGTRNHLLKYFFAFISACGLQYIYYKKKTGLILTVVLSISQFIYFQISTAITCSVLLFGLFVIKNVLKEKLNMKSVLIISTILSVAFVFFNAANFFSWFIINFLHKDVGLNSRNLIWTEAIKIIFSNKVKLIFGNGIYNNGNFISLYGLYWPAHNQLLEWLFEYGILGTGLLYIFYLKLDKRIKWGNDYLLIIVVCFTIFVASISSGPLSGAPGYMALCLLPNLNSFRKDSSYHI